MNRRYRLKSSADFRRVRRTGKSYAHPLVILIVAPNMLDKSRCGFVAGKAMGSAVVRNRAKRRLRAALQSLIKEIPAGWDIILIARPLLLKAPWDELKEAIANLLKRANLIMVKI